MHNELENVKNTVRRLTSNLRQEFSTAETCDHIFPYEKKYILADAHILDGDLPVYKTGEIVTVRGSRSFWGITYYPTLYFP